MRKKAVANKQSSHCNQARNLLQSNRPQEAMRLLEGALRKNSNDAAVLELLATAYLEIGNYLGASRAYSRLIEFEPRSFSHFNNLGNILALLGDYPTAIRTFEHAIQLDPTAIDAYTNLANLFNADAKYEQAEALYRDALLLKPNHSQAIAGLATILEKKGAYDEAYKLLLPLLRKPKPHVTVIAALAANARHLKKEREAILIIENFLRNNTIARHYGVALNFGLGDLYHRVKDYDSAFKCITKGSQLRGHSYNQKQAEQFVEDIISTFSKDFFRNAPRAANKSFKPVFVIGMPRSGTTLTEQIISSHPDVYGAGELTDLPRLLAGVSGYPKAAGKLGQAKLTELSQAYLSCLDSYGTIAKRVTDKLPVNFIHLGMIELLFSNARVVHCTRHPIDVCLSCYFQLFTHKQEFSYNIENLGHFYKLYERLMAHWNDVLTIKTMECKYENLVYNQEEVSRELIEFCELPWDDSCLQFYNSKRSVNTASYYQVTQPIYTKAIDKWRRYEKQLAPLIEILGF